MSTNLEEQPEGGAFTCMVCGMSEKYDYKGRSPPFSRWVTFSEDAYIMRDPFSPRREAQFLLLGSDCSVCSKQVCQRQGCSVFYSKRFCKPCAEENAGQFPHEMQVKIKRMAQCKD